METRIRRMYLFSSVDSFHKANGIYGVFVLLLLYLLDMPSASHGMEHEGLSRSELIRQQCDGLPTSRRLLIATPNRQKKEYRFTHGDTANLPSSSGSLAEGAACDVWDIQPTMEKWVAIALTKFEFQQNDSLFIIRELKTGQTRVERFGLDVHATGFSSMGLLTLLWVRRNLLPLPNGNGPMADRTLAFFYFTDNSPNEEENNDELILISAIIISLITLAATVLSLVRSASCHRICLPCWLRRHRRVFSRNSSSYSSAPPEEEHAGIVSTSTVISTTRRTSGGPETYLLMEMEVTRSVTLSNDEDNNGRSVSHTLDSEYESTLPPRYDEVVGHNLVDFRRERQMRTLGEPSDIPETAGEVVENSDNAWEEEDGLEIHDAIGGQSFSRRSGDLSHAMARTPLLTHNISEPDASVVVDRAMLSHGNSTSLNQRDLHDNTSQHTNNVIGRTLINDQRNDSNHNDEDQDSDSTFPGGNCSPLQDVSTDTTTAALIMSSRPDNEQNAHRVTTTTTTPTRPASASSRSNPPPPIALLRSAGVVSPSSWRPCLHSLPGFRGATAGDSSDISRDLNPLEMRASLLSRGDADVDGTDEAPPPSYYDESPPPSYDSIYPPNDL